jgi:hypothetical protein
VGTAEVTFGRAVALIVMAALLSFGFLFFLSASQPTPIPTGTNTFYYGNIVRGARFGVRIGDHLADASAALRKYGLKYEPVSAGCEYDEQRLEGCKPSQRYEVFFINKFVWHGRVFLEVRNSRVISIVWSAYLLPYIDL